LTYSRAVANRWIASHEPHLRPRAFPTIGPAGNDVAFRGYDGRDQLFDDEFLRLTIIDARELVVALNHLIEDRRARLIRTVRPEV
jgi:hypothetical protein